MITALNWHAVKDTRADFSWRRGSNHLVLLSSDHPWWSLGTKLIVCCVQSISIQVTPLGELKRVVQLSSLARGGTVSVQQQFRASDFKYVFFEIAYKTWLLASVNRVYFPLHMPLYVYYCRADYDTSCWWLWNDINLFEEKSNASPLISK